MINTKISIHKTAFGYHAMIEKITGKDLGAIEKTGQTNKDEETAVVQALRMVYGNEICYYWQTNDGWIGSDEKPENEAKKAEKSRADDMKKSRASAGGIVQARLTKKANTSLENLCAEWKMTKTEVINKLLEESDQRQLL